MRKIHELRRSLQEIILRAIAEGRSLRQIVTGLNISTERMHSRLMAGGMSLADVEIRINKFTEHIDMLLDAAFPFAPSFENYDITRRMVPMSIVILGQLSD